MIPNDQPLRKQTIKRMISYLEDGPNIVLTDWERDFVESISDQFRDKQDLSNRQCEFLERIYDKNE